MRKKFILVLQLFLTDNNSINSKWGKRQKCPLHCKKKKKMNIYIYIYIYIYMYIFFFSSVEDTLLSHIHTYTHNICTHSNYNFFLKLYSWFGSNLTF